MAIDNIARGLVMQTRTALNVLSGLIANGSTDNSAAFHAADSKGPVVVPKGTYAITNAITFSSHVTFMPGSRFILFAADVTFTRGITAGDFQIFGYTGSGKVRGLSKAQQAWFDGDIRNLPGLPFSTTECDAALQNAFDALIDGGTLYGDPGQRIKGTAYIDPRGAYYEGNGCSFLWDTATTNLFTVNAAAQSRYLSDFAAAPVTPGTIPLTGTAILINTENHDLRDIRIYDAFNGVLYASGGICTATGVKLSGCRNFGLCNKITDLTIDKIILDAGSDWIDLSNIVGTFLVGDTITIVGTTGVISAVYSNMPTRYRIKFYDAMPATNMTITSSSGGSAKISGVTIAHQSGGIRVEGNVEAFALGAIECFGGLYGLVAISASGALGRTGNTAFCRISDDAYFDTTYLGSTIQGAYGTTIEGWFANTRVRSAPGLTLTLCQRLRISAQFVSNSGAGLVIDGASCKNIRIKDFEFDGNCRQNNGEASMAELVVTGAMQYLSISDGEIGLLGLNGVQPPLAIWFDAAASDYLTISGVNMPSGSGGIHNGSTGTHNVGLS